MNMNSDNLPNIGSVSTIEIYGLSIRHARGGASKGTHILLTAPYPESFYAFHRLVPHLVTEHPILLVDLPGFGHSQSRPNVMSPEAMGNFVIKLLKHFGIKRTHSVSPDVGTPAVLFAATKQQDLFESLVIGGAAMQPDLASSVLKDLIYSPPGSLAAAGSDAVKPYLEHAALLTPSAIIEDFRAASAGRRFEEATQFVRGYIQDSPKLEPQLRSIKTPALIIAGKEDPIVPPINGQFLADRLPNNRFMLLDAGHRYWEEAADKYIETLLSWFGGDYHSLEKRRDKIESIE
jgi:pimeloyl-ACP methyl ester carboxylesterase